MKYVSATSATDSTEVFMQDLKERTFFFAVTVGKLIPKLPFNAVNKVYTGQLGRSPASAGADYRAARRAGSGADFLHKLKIVKEGCDEFVYFLELHRDIEDHCFIK
jgi:four helix bundle protein